MQITHEKELNSEQLRHQQRAKETGFPSYRAMVHKNLFDNNWSGRSRRELCHYLLTALVRAQSCSGLPHEALVLIKPDWHEMIPLLEQLIETRLMEGDYETIMRMRILAVRLLGRMGAVSAIPVLQRCHDRTRQRTLKHAISEVLPRLYEYRDQQKGDRG